VLDGDTRDYLELLVGGAGKGLAGRGEDLRQTFKRLEPLHRDLAAVNTSVAKRRTDLKHLIHDYGDLMTQLSTKDEDLTRLVRAGNDTFSALASQDDNLSLAVQRLPGALNESRHTLGRVDTLAQELTPTLNSLRPAVRRLDETNAAVLPFVREAEPIVRKQIRPFTRIAQPYVRNLGLAAKGLSAATPDLTTSLGEVNRFVNIGAFNPVGRQRRSQGNNPREGFLYWLAWTAQNGVSLHSTGDGQGVRRRLTLCGLDVPAATAQLEPGLANALGNGTILPGNLDETFTALLSAEFGTCSFQGVNK
jgi:phospholipid/cholesterol/gamma-HCH transport system substrate-binding protein